MMGEVRRGRAIDPRFFTSEICERWALTLTPHSMALFDHEKLKVYQEAIRFVTWSNDLLGAVPRSVAVHNQLDRASTSVALNIAEGNGKRPSADRQVLRHRPSVCVGVCGAPRCLDSEKEDRVADSTYGKAILLEVVSILVGLIRANSQRDA